MSENKRKNKELLTKYLTTHDKSAYDELFMANTYLINYVISRRFNISNNDKTKYEDFYSEGCLALDYAIKSFDILKIDEIQFSTFAITCIYHKLLNKIRDEKKLKNESSHLEDTIGKEDERTYGEMISNCQNIPDDVVENEYFVKYRKQKVLKAINKLGERDRRILELYHGFDDNERLSQSEIASIFNISQIQVSRILRRIYNLLKGELKEFDSRKVSDENNDNEKLFKYKEITYVDNDEDFGLKTEYLNELYDIYGKLKLVIAMDKIDFLQREVLTLYFGIEKERMWAIVDIANFLNTDVEKIEEIVNKGNERLFNILNFEIDDKSNEEKKNASRDRKQIFLKKHSKEEIAKAISELEENDREVLELYFGVNGPMIKPFKISKILNMNRLMCNSRIYSAFNRLEQKFDFVEEVVKDTTLDFLNYKYGEVKVKEAVFSLDKEDKKLFNMYFCDSKSTKEIASELNIKHSVFYIKLISVIRKVEGNINSIGKNSNYKGLIKLFYRRFISKDSKVINKAISRLRYKEKDLIRFIINNPNLLMTDIAIKLHVEEFYFKLALERIVNEINDEIRDINDESLSESDLIYKRRNEFISLLVNDNESIIMEKLNCLTNKERKILSLYYGIDGACFVDDIAKILNVDRYEVRNVIKTSIFKLNKLLVKGNPKK